MTRLKVTTMMCIFISNHTHTGRSMRTNIIIDDKLMSAALKTSGRSTKKEVVEDALKLLVQIKKQSRLKSLRGKIKWEGNLTDMRTSR